jgi:hypothetical protein
VPIAPAEPSPLEVAGREWVAAGRPVPESLQAHYAALSVMNAEIHVMRAARFAQEADVVDLTVSMAKKKAELDAAKRALVTAKTKGEQWASRVFEPASLTRSMSRASSVSSLATPTSGNAPGHFAFAQ